VATFELLSRLAGETREDVREIRRMLEGVAVTQARHDERLDNLEARPAPRSKRKEHGMLAGASAGGAVVASAVYVLLQMLHVLPPAAH